MVQPSFSAPGQDGSSSSSSPSPTAALDVFLDKQHQSYFEELYQSEAACLCILRLLPPVVRSIILSRLWSFFPPTAVELKALCRIDAYGTLGQIEEILRPAMDRKIFGPFGKSKGKSMQTGMNETFKKGLRNALTGLGTSNSFGVPWEGSSDEVPFSEEDLTQYGEDTWESILRYMVSSGLSGGISTSRPRPQVLQLLYSSGLMADYHDATGVRPNMDRLTITSKGFQFLLEERQTQLWQILMYYIASKELGRERSAEILSVFFTLGCMQLGQAYSASVSFPRSSAVLDDLEHYGFIYRSEADPDRIYPTHLATSLTSDDASTSASTSQSVDEKRFLILETNYKIYAYTSNELEIAILNLFVDIRVRYRNLVVGKLDRQNVKAAMEKGISANQIIAYLASHAHPQMYSSPPPLLHPTITDQLHLWDKERNRLKTEESVMFEFFSKELYEETEGEAQRYGGLHLSLPTQKLLFIDPEIKEAIKAFVQDKQSQLRLG